MDSNPKKILILEDDRSLVRALELKLVHEGFEVTSLLNGENVLSAVKKDHFSLIVCDLMMPGVDGFQVLQILKDNKIKIPVIILTNLSQTEDEKRVKELGAIDFLVKSDTPLSKIIENIKEKLVD